MMRTEQLEPFSSVIRDRRYKEVFMLFDNWKKRLTIDDVAGNLGRTPKEVEPILEELVKERFLSLSPSSNGVSIFHLGGQ